MAPEYVDWGVAFFPYTVPHAEIFPIIVLLYCLHGREPVPPPSSNLLVGVVAPSPVVRRNQFVDILVGIDINLDYLAKGKDWLYWITTTEIKLFSDYFFLGAQQFL